MRKIVIILLLTASCALAAENESVIADDPLYQDQRIGFSTNLLALSSMTFEGRFLWRIIPRITLVFSPNYQNTPRIPFWHPSQSRWDVFDIQRLNAGLGVRVNFFRPDSLSAWYIEPLLRSGAAWFGNESANWSLIPSVLFGYSAAFDSGLRLSSGIGLEWEFLVGNQLSYHARYLKSAYFQITKIPIIAELSLGWMW